MALIVLVAIVLPQVASAKSADTANVALYGSIIVFFIIAILYFVIRAAKGSYAKK